MEVLSFHTPPSVYPNGVDGITGKYLIPSCTVVEWGSRYDGADSDTELASIETQLADRYFGLPDGADPKDIGQVGWAVVCHESEKEELYEALEPLFRHRRKQVRLEGPILKLDYRPGESVYDWLRRHRVAQGAIQPSRVPYYLLIAASPDKIAFEFSQMLAFEYAVGRLAFNSTEEYAQYARSLVHYETSHTQVNRKVISYFSPSNQGDAATQLSATHLVQPLAEGSCDQVTNEPVPPVGSAVGYGSELLKNVGASKEALVRLIDRSISGKPPTILFTASHGIGFTTGHQNQSTRQGALLCQNWPGTGSISPDMYFAASDVKASSGLFGSVIFSFACFSAGTPLHDRYYHATGLLPAQLIDIPRVAALAQAFLAHSDGGAIGFIGHVDRAWGYSIVPNGSANVQPFRNTLRAIARGQPLGHALRDFRDRYAALSIELLHHIEQEKIQAGDPSKTFRLWIARNDAEGYALIGDPAARILDGNLTPNH